MTVVATVSRLHGGNATYYTKSYYLNGQADGEWLETNGAARLKLAGKPVMPQEFERLLRGFHPVKDEPLVQNAGDKRRQLGWDVQFGVDKSFSVVYALVPEARGELEASLKEAVRSAIVEVLEPEFLETRRGKGGRLREPVSSPVATFLHRTNRENEIHLHCHAAIPNVGIRKDGTAGSIVSWNFYDAKLALGKAFHARFSEQVATRLGIACEFDETGLSRVRGFPEPVAAALSTPARKIAEQAEDRTARAKEEANLKNRPSKREVPLAAVAADCRDRAEGLGFTAADARAFLGRVDQARHPNEAEAARALLRGVVENLPGEFSKAQLFERAFREGAKAGLPFSAIREAAHEAISNEVELHHLGRVGGREQYRKTAVAEAGNTPFGSTEASEKEKEFREFLGRIIEKTPELKLAEFLPAPDGPPSDARDPHPRKDDARPPLEVVGPPDGRAQTAPGEGTRVAPREDFEWPAAATPGRTPGESRRSIVAEGGALGAPSLAGTDPHHDGSPEEQARSPLRKAGDRVRDRLAEASIDSALTRALGRATEREAHFTHRDLADALEEELSGKDVPPLRQAAVLDAALQDPKRVVALGAVRGEDHFTTPEMLRVEAEGIRAAEVLQGRRGHAQERPEVRRKLGEMPAAERNAVARALSGSDLVLIEGTDGLRMQAVQRGLARAIGPKADVLWVAPTATAARELERSVGAGQAATLQKLLYSLDRGVGETVAHHGAMLVNAALGRPTWDARQLALTPKTTVILDSAGLADTRQFSRLLQHASSSGARVIGCSTHEIPGLGPGGFLRELRVRSEAAHVVALPGGPEKRVEVLGHRSREEAKKDLIEQWGKEAIKRPEEHTIVGVSSRDVHELNLLAQAKRKEAGLLGFRSIEVRYRLYGELVKERIYEGDRVVFTARTDREVVNGVFGTVKHIDLITGRVKVQLDLKEKKYLQWEFDRQKTIKFRYRNYRFFQRQEEGFRLGYAATVYRSQNVAVAGQQLLPARGTRRGPQRRLRGAGARPGHHVLLRRRPPGASRAVGGEAVGPRRQEAGRPRGVGPGGGAGEAAGHAAGGRAGLEPEHGHEALAGGRGIPARFSSRGHHGAHLSGDNRSNAARRLRPDARATPRR